MPISGSTYILDFIAAIIYTESRDSWAPTKTILKGRCIRKENHDTMVNE